MSTPEASVDWVESLLALDSFDDAHLAIRAAHADRRATSEALRRLAQRVNSERPAAARLARRLAASVDALLQPRPWPGDPVVDSRASAALRAASTEVGLWATYSVVRRHRALFGPTDLISVLAWHAGLESKGLPPESNGAALVMCLGVVLGGASQGMAHLAWARGCEQDDQPERALHHLRRAVLLMERTGDPQVTAVARAALSAFNHRHGLPDEPTVGANPEAITPLTMPFQEVRAHDLRDAGQPLDALAVALPLLAATVDYGDLAREVRLRNLLGLVYEDLESFDLAEGEFRRSAELANRMGDYARAWEGRINLAGNMLKRHLHARAVAEYASLVDQADREGTLSMRVAARNNLGLALSEAEDLLRARAAYEQGLALQDPAVPTRSLAITQQGLSGVLHRLGDAEGAAAAAAALYRQWEDHGAFEAWVMYLFTDAASLDDTALRARAEETLDWLLDRGDLFQGPMLALRLARVTRPTDPMGAVRRCDQVIAAFPILRGAHASLFEVERVAAEIEAEDLRRPDLAIDRLRHVLDQLEQRLAAIDARSQDRLLAAAGPLLRDLLELLLQQHTDVATAEAFDLHEATRPRTLSGALLTEGYLDGDTAARSRTARLAEVRAALRDDKVLRVGVVSFAETNTGLVAFVLGPHDVLPQVVPLPVTRAQIDDATEELADAMNGNLERMPPRLPPNPAAPDRTPLARMTDLLAALSPAATALNLHDLDLLIFVPTSSLDGLPLHAMLGRGARPLVEEIGVSYEVSLTALVADARAELGDNASPAVFAAGVAAREDARPERFEDDATLFDHLGAAVHRVEGVCATSAAILDGMRGAAIAHITCHGYVDRRDPLDSGLLVSTGTERPSRRIGSVPVLQRARSRLTLRDLITEDLDVGLLTLRACSTARRSVEVEGTQIGTLLQGFLHAGCRAIVASLWNVDQESSLDLLEQFYRAYLDGRPAWDALARAQRSFIASGGPRSHLYHWAPFTATGQWRRT